MAKSAHSRRRSTTECSGLLDGGTFTQSYPTKTAIAVENVYSASRLLLGSRTVYPFSPRFQSPQCFAGSTAIDFFLLRGPAGLRLRVEGLRSRGSWGGGANIPNSGGFRSSN